MATRKSAASKVVEEVEEVDTPEPEVSQDVPAPVVETDEPEVVVPTTKRGIPNNTWTLTYGRYTIDLVEGVETELPLTVYNYLRRQGNLIGRL